MGSLKADRLNASRLHLDWGPIDIRKGFIGLAAAAQQHQRRDACSGVALAFCRRRGIFEQGLGLYPSRLLKRGESQGGEALDVSQNIKDLARGSGPKGSGSLQRSEEHTSELQSLMRISYAVFCLKTKKEHKKQYNIHIHRVHNCYARMTTTPKQKS